MLSRPEWETYGRISRRDVYARRILRIVPGLCGFIGVMGALTVLGVSCIAPIHFVSAATLVWNYKHIWDCDSGAGNWFLGHVWSLSFEEQSYLLWPVTLVVVGVRRAVLFCVVLILCVPLVWVATYFLWPDARRQLGMMIHTSADRLMFGCSLALWGGHPRLDRTLQACRNPIWPVVAVAFLVFVSPALGHGFGGAYGLPVGRTLEGLAIAFVLGWLLRDAGCVAGRFLNSRPLVVVGVLSYSLYLGNPLVVTPLNDSWTGRFPVNLLCTFVAATVSSAGG